MWGWEDGEGWGKLGVEGARRQQSASEIRLHLLPRAHDCVDGQYEHDDCRLHPPLLLALEPRQTVRQSRHAKQDLDQPVVELSRQHPPQRRLLFGRQLVGPVHTLQHRRLRPAQPGSRLHAQPGQQRLDRQSVRLRLGSRLRFDLFHLDLFRVGLFLLARVGDGHRNGIAAAEPLHGACAARACAMDGPRTPRQRGKAGRAGGRSEQCEQRRQHPRHDERASCATVGLAGRPAVYFGQDTHAILGPCFAPGSDGS